MKKYITKICMMVFSLVLPFALYYCYVQSLQDYGSKSIGATIRYKIDLIQETEGERIILVGGSSSPYGTICSEFEERFDKNCINIGATAYLGLEYYINILEKYARAGDTVVIAPEHILLKNKAVDYVVMWIAAGTDKDALACIPFSYYGGMFSAFNDYSKLKIENKDKKLVTSVHSHFGPKGDVTKEREALLEQGYNTQDIIYLNKEGIYQDNLDLLNKYAVKAEEKGVKVFFAFAPVDRLAIATDTATNAEFEKAVTDYLDITAVLDLNTAIMDGRYFYDTNNHLTSEGAEIYTAELIKGLAEYIS